MSPVSCRPQRLANATKARGEPPRTTAGRQEMGGAQRSDTPAGPQAAPVVLMCGYEPRTVPGNRKGRSTQRSDALGWHGIRWLSAGCPVRRLQAPRQVVEGPSLRRPVPTRPPPTHREPADRLRVTPLQRRRCTPTTQGLCLDTDPRTHRSLGIATTSARAAGRPLTAAPSG